MITLEQLSSVINIFGWPLACIWMIFEVRAVRREFKYHITYLHRRRDDTAPNVHGMP
jgi:hypothetical protein